MSPNGVSMMFKAFGIDPQAIVEQFQQQIQGFQDVVVVFDKRLSDVERLVAEIHAIVSKMEKNHDEENRTEHRLIVVGGE